MNVEVITSSNSIHKVPCISKSENNKRIQNAADYVAYLIKKYISNTNDKRKEV